LILASEQSPDRLFTRRMGSCSAFAASTTSAARKSRNTRTRGEWRRGSSLFSDLRLRAFRSSTFPMFDVTRGSLLLFGISSPHDGIRRTRQFNLLRVLIAPDATDTRTLTNSPHVASLPKSSECPRGVALHSQSCGRARITPRVDARTTQTEQRRRTTAYVIMWRTGSDVTGVLLCTMLQLYYVGIELCIVLVLGSW